MNQKEFTQKKLLFINYLQNEKRLSANTVRVYNSDLDQIQEFWSHYDKETDFETILEQFSKSLFQNIDNNSVARKFSCLNTFQKFIAKSEGIPFNKKLKRPLVSQKIPVILNKQEITYLMDTAIENDLPTKYPLRDKAILELLYATGIRCAELVQIELNNIDFNNQLIIIRNKSKKERCVFFGSKALKRIKDYLEYERIQSLTSNEKLFLNYRNDPLTTRSVQRICEMFRLCLENKNTNITPYILRHSFAAHMLSNGADIDKIQDLLGHKTKSSTEKYLQILSKKTK